MNLTPIGIYHSELKAPYEAGRQASEKVRTQGQVILNKHQQFEQALEDLEGFDRLWLIYQFHLNTTWKPKVLPPRGSRVRRGVFATRAPYRPNPLGLSCVRLLQIESLVLTVEGADLLDGTPILDVKPYLPYADSFPDAKTGWLQDIEAARFAVTFTETASAQLEFLHQEGLGNLRDFIWQQLEYDPFDANHKRVRQESADSGCLAYKTWRARFSVSEGAISVLQIFSGYSLEEISSNEDPYQDKAIHRKFIAVFP